MNITKGTILFFIMVLAGALPVSAQQGTSGTEAAAPPAAAAVPVIKPSLPAGGMAAEWEFLKTRGKDKDEDVAAIVLPELSDWLKLYPDSEYAAEAQLLKAEIHLKLGDYRSAIVDLLKHTQEYPDSGSNASAVKLLGETLDKKMDKKTRPVLSEAGKAPEAGGKAERLAALLKKLAERAGGELYEPVAGELREFSGRFPSYAGRDELYLALGDLHFKKEEYLRARLAYEKLITLYPDSRLLVKAKRSLGDVLANNLKDYDGAISVYQDVAANYPGTEEAWAAYGQLAKLSERQKRYGLAVDVHEKIIALYPEKAAAYDSFQAEARILRDELSKPAEAAAVLGRLADKYKGEKAIEALYLAAKIAKKDLKDLEAEIKMYGRISTEYPNDKEAPKALFASAEAYEAAQNFEQARAYYGKVSEKYPEDSLSAKAQKRLNAIINK